MTLTINRPVNDRRTVKSVLALLRATPLTEHKIKEVVRNITADGSVAAGDGSV